VDRPNCLSQIGRRHEINRTGSVMLSEGKRLDRTIRGGSRTARARMTPDVSVQIRRLSGNNPNGGGS
jgi:hypothetical protein